MLALCRLSCHPRRQLPRRRTARDDVVHPLSSEHVCRWSNIGLYCERCRDLGLCACCRPRLNLFRRFSFQADRDS